MKRLNIELRNVPVGRGESALLASLLALAIKEEVNDGGVSSEVDRNDSLAKCCREVKVDQ